MSRKNGVVVGGGLCGLFASILLADKFEQVYIVETDEHCGGLLKSVRDDRGIFYDQGTHIPDQTRVPEIDQILFGSEKEIQENWTDLEDFKSGNYFEGKWNLENMTADARCLSKEIYNKGTLELLSRVEPSHAEDVLTYLIETIGPTFTSEIAGPVVKKLYDESPAILTTGSSVSYFGLTRLIALTPQVTNKLKELEVFDEKLSYHTNSDYQKRLATDGIALSDNYRPKKYYYPKRNVGVYFWIQRLVRLAEAKGVRILNNEYVEKIEHDKNSIKSLTLGKCKKTLNCDFLLWTAPPALALGALNIPVPKANLQFRTANIFHYSYDQALLNQESHCLWNWDRNYKGFRVTLYPNMQPEIQPSLNNITIEALSNAEEADGITLELMHEELVRMGLVADSANILSQLKQTVHNTFPVPTFEFRQAVENTSNQLTESFDNVLLAGRFSGKKWFHVDVIKEVYYEVNARFS